MRQGVWFFGAALAMTLAGGMAQGMAQGATQPAPSMVEDHSGLTRERFRRNCLMCHNRAAPEGIAPEIMAGLYPEPGKAPREMMPGLVCWRRCTACRLPDKPSRR
jgi:hypothetical protein